MNQSRREFLKLTGLAAGATLTAGTPVVAAGWTGTNPAQGDRAIVFHLSLLRRRLWDHRRHGRWQGGQHRG